MTDPTLIADMVRAGVDPEDEQSIRDAYAGGVAMSVLLSRVWPDNARRMHRAVSDALRKEGFRVVDEYFIRGAFGDRNGRIDIAAEYKGGGVAIELDTRRPRRRSIVKLKQVEGFRIIGLRGVECATPKGIDAVACLRVTV